MFRATGLRFFVLSTILILRPVYPYTTHTHTHKHNTHTHTHIQHTHTHQHDSEHTCNGVCEEGAYLSSRLLLSSPISPPAYGITPGVCVCVPVCVCVCVCHSGVCVHTHVCVCMYIHEYIYECIYIDLLSRAFVEGLPMRP